MNQKYISYFVVLVIITGLFLQHPKQEILANAVIKTQKSELEDVYSKKDALSKTLPYIETKGVFTCKTYPSANVRIINNTSKTFFFSGYNPEMPIYQIESFINGSWIQPEISWCGTGVRPRELFPHTSIIARIVVRKQLMPLRIGISFRETISNTKWTVWSESIYCPNVK